MDIDQKRARMSLYSALSIIAVMLMCTAAWQMLDTAQKTYKKMIIGSKTGKTAQTAGSRASNRLDTKQLKQTETLAEESKKNLSRETQIKSQANPIFQKIMAGLYIAEAKMHANSIQSQLAENEKTAIKTLQKYAQAQKKFYEFYGYYAEDAAELIIEQDGKYTILDPDLGVLNRALSRENASNGYFYVETTKPSLKAPEQTISYILSAVPAEYGLSGLNTFCIDQGGIVFQKNNGAKPVNDSKYLDQSWQSVDQ